MTDDDLFSLFCRNHYARLFNYAFGKARGNWQDAEDGLQVALCELWPEVVEHFKAVLIKDRTDAKQSILPRLWTRIRNRVWDARRKSLKHEQPLGQSVLPVEAHDNEPANTSTDSTDAAIEMVEMLRTSKWNHLSETEKKVIQLTILREPPMTYD